MLASVVTKPFGGAYVLSFMLGALFGFLIAKLFKKEKTIYKVSALVIAYLLVAVANELLFKATDPVYLHTQISLLVMFLGNLFTIVIF